MHTGLHRYTQGYIGDTQGYIGDTQGYIGDTQGYVGAHRVTYVRTGLHR